MAQNPMKRGNHDKVGQAFPRPLGLVNDDGEIEDIGAANPLPITDSAGHQYELVAAGATDQMMGGAGAVGDYLHGILVIPATTSPGAVSIEDGAANTVVFTGGASSVSNLVPFFIPLGLVSVTGGWEITTGAAVSLIVTGRFTA